jgi:hypothetical protein
MELFKVFLLECGPHPHIAFSYFFWWCHIGSNVSRILCGMMVLLRWPVAFVGSSVPNYSSACMHEYVFVRLRFFLMTRCRLRRSIPSWYVALTNCIRTLEACSLMTRQFEWPIDCVVREDLELGSQNHYSQSLFSYFSMRLAAGVTIWLHTQSQYVCRHEIIAMSPVCTHDGVTLSLERLTSHALTVLIATICIWW